MWEGEYSAQIIVMRYILIFNDADHFSQVHLSMTIPNRDESHRISGPSDASCTKWSTARPHLPISMASRKKCWPSPTSITKYDSRTASTNRPSTPWSYVCSVTRNRDPPLSARMVYWMSIAFYTGGKNRINDKWLKRDEICAYFYSFFVFKKNYEILTQVMFTECDAHQFWEITCFAVKNSYYSMLPIANMM